jgi:hypothetical protein
VFCRSATESRDHLFFSCSFSYKIWKTCLQGCHSLAPLSDWFDIISEGYIEWKTKALRGVLCRLILSATVYGLWRASNEIKFSRQPRIEEQILKQIF